MFQNLALFKGEVVGQQSKSNVVQKESLSKPIIRVDSSIKQSQSQSQLSSSIRQLQPQTQLTQLTHPQIQKSNKKRVMLCGTYPIGQSNGYSRVVYYISKFIGLKAADDIQLTIYGFQNFKQTAGTRTDIPSNVILHDAMATEEPKRGGFGEKEIGGYLKNNPQDIVIIFNDMVITSACVETIVNELTPIERKSFKLYSS